MNEGNSEFKVNRYGDSQFIVTLQRILTGFREKIADSRFIRETDSEFAKKDGEFKKKLRSKQ